MSTGREVCRGAIREAVGDTLATRRARTILFVGEVNPPSSQSRYALYPYPPNCAGERLCNGILGANVGQYLACWRTNLSTGWWKLHEARQRATELMERSALLPHLPLHPASRTRIEVLNPPWSIVVMLGRKVADAIVRSTKFARFDFFEVKKAKWFDENQTIFVPLPHPSGRCREWNDPISVKRARIIMRELAPEMEWGPT